MVQRGEDLRFALEAGEPIGIGREHVRQDLDRDIAPELRIARAIDLAHAAGPDQGGDFIRAEAGAGRESQRVTVDYTGRTAVLGPTPE